MFMHLDPFNIPEAKDTTFATGLPSGVMFIYTYMKRKTNEIVDQQLIDNTIPLIRIDQYVNNHTKMKWRCTTCNNIVISTADKILNAGVRCASSTCTKKHPITNQRIDKLLLPFNVSRLSNTSTITTAITVNCNTCDHVWMATPKSIIQWTVKGCPNCLQLVPITNNSIDKFLSNNAPTIARLDDVSNARTKIKWQCLTCNHTWQTTPNKITSSKTGCPKCSKSCRWSQVAVKWLSDISDKIGQRIQHAENGGEYKIPKTKLFVDGFCAQTNTVYEFYGDQWHGNPELFEPSDNCHPFNKHLTARELYNATMLREKQIQNLGYNIISIWEHEYNAL